MRKPKMKPFCDNPRCENEAVERVLVSIHKPNDGWRSMCAACKEAYIWGMQHATHLCGGYVNRMDLQAGPGVRIFFEEPIHEDAPATGWITLPWTDRSKSDGQSTLYGVTLNLPRIHCRKIIGMKFRDLQKMALR